MGINIAKYTGEIVRWTSKSTNCPLCSQFLRKNRSKAVWLPAMRICSADGGVTNYWTGGFFYSDGRTASTSLEMNWAHANCASWFMEQQDQVRNTNVLVVTRSHPRGSKSSCRKGQKFPDFLAAGGIILTLTCPRIRPTDIEAAA